MKKTRKVGAVLGVAVQGTATSRLEGQQEQRWGGPEIGLNLALGRGRFHDFVTAAGGFGAYGTLPIDLHGGLGVRGLRNGVASYVTENGVTHNSDGSFTIRPIRSEANLLLIQLGVSVSLR